jgi:predicted DNA-binding transcriptional regulator YafY
MSKLERIMTFHGWVKDGRFPSLKRLQDSFEVSRATASRDVEFMRDRLGAPLEYDRENSGYYYSSENFRMPFEGSQNTLVFAALLNKMAERTGLSGMEEFRRIKNSLGQCLFDKSKETLNHISCEFVEIEPPPENILPGIIESLNQRTDISIRYRDARGNKTRRRIRPLRLHGYQGQWYLVAFCFLREKLRMFHTGRIEQIDILDSKIEIPEELNLEEYLSSPFGIFKGDFVKRVRLEFTGVAANIVGNQVWHKDQEITQTEDGIILSIPVADFQEVKMAALKYGSNARVLGPEELRDEIEKEIRAMAAKYEQL